MAIESPSAMSDATPKATMTEAPVTDPIPDNAIMAVVHSPSSPPYTADLMYSPPAICF